MKIQGKRVFFYTRRRLSKGLNSGNLGTVFRVVEWTYFFTISREVWPRICCKAYISPPFSKYRVANVCRRRWARSRGMPERFFSLRNIWRRVESVTGSKLDIKNTRSVDAQPGRRERYRNKALRVESPKEQYVVCCLYRPR